MCFGLDWKHPWIVRMWYRNWVEKMALWHYRIRTFHKFDIELEESGLSLAAETDHLAAPMEMTLAKARRGVDVD